MLHGPFFSFLPALVGEMGDSGGTFTFVLFHFLPLVRQLVLLVTDNIIMTIRSVVCSPFLFLCVLLNGGQKTAFYERQAPESRKHNVLRKVKKKREKKLNETYYKRRF